MDCAIVMDHLILQAADLRLGTCCIGAFDPAAARRLLDLPSEWEPIAFTPLGYPADTYRPKTRKPLEELVVRRQVFTPATSALGSHSRSRGDRALRP